MTIPNLRILLSLGLALLAVQPAAAQCQLGAPTGVTTTPGCGAITISWSSVPSAYRYLVYRTNTPVYTGYGTPWSVQGTSFQDSSATVGSTYYYWVQTWCVAGAGGTTTTGVPGTRVTAPPTPTGLVVMNGTSCAGVTLNWSVVATATQYRIYRATGTTMPISPIATVGTNTFLDSTASPGTSYRYWVQSANACNPISPQGSPAAGPVSGVRLAALNAPSGVAAGDGASCVYVRVTWNAVAGAAGYQVWRNGSMLAGAATSPFDDFSAVAGTTYTYAVVATSGVSNCSSPLSNSNTGFRAGVPAAVNTTAVVAGPFCGQATVSWSAIAGAANYDVYRQGALIATVSASPYIDTPPSSGGWMYWVSARNACGSSSQGVSRSATVTTSAGYQLLGAGCAGSLPRASLVALAPPCTGTTMQVRVNNLPAGVAFMLTGTSNLASSIGPLPINLAQFGMPGCTGYVSADAMSLLQGASTQATYVLAIPQVASLISMFFYQQALVLDPGAANSLGAVMSDAAAARVGG